MKILKKMYMILFTMSMLFAGFVFAADFDVNITPDMQYAISGSVVTFDVVAQNNTGFSSVFVLNLPNEIEYINASVIPFNNPALSLGVDTNPNWVLSSGQTLTVQVTADVNVLLFTNLLVTGDIDVYTSAIVSVEPISDVVLTKTLISNEPQMTGDVVTYNIEIKNIGSKLATGIEVVDVWPANVLNFQNLGFVNGIMQVPTIYNGLIHNYLFTIPDILPGGSVQLELSGSMDNIFSVGHTFTNSAFVLVDSNQYSTGNDAASIVNTVRGLSDIFVNVTQISTNPSLSGDMIGYRISYGNSGTDTATGVVLQNTFSNEFVFLTSSVVATNQVGNISSWDLGSLSQGQVGSIVVTGSLLGGLSAGTVFGDNAQISTLDIEINTANNVNVVTGAVSSILDMSVNLYANNLTEASRTIDTGTQIFAISGDMVELQIEISNDGNSLEIGLVSITNINEIVGYAGLTSWNINLAAGTTQIIVLTGLVGPQNYVSFVPLVNLSYDNLSETDSVAINEPLECGDGLITQTEVCDINGQIGNLLSGQQCVEHNGQCLLETADITNTVCMQYTTVLGTGEQCMSIIVPYQNIDQVMCESLTSPYSVVIVDESDNRGNMNFTCNTVGNDIANEIKIDCGNGDVGTTTLSSSFVYNCEYEYNDSSLSNNLYNVQCYVDGDTVAVDECQSTIRVDEGFYGVCGDGTMDDGEECDLGGEEDEEDKIRRYLDLDENYRAGRYDDGRYYCEDCKIRKSKTNEFVYQPPQCLGTNTTLSVMEDELIPFRWRLWERDNMKLRNNYDCDDIDIDENRTIIDKDSMKCTFAIYNGVDYLQADEDEVNKFTVDCFEEEKSVFFDYFEETYKVDFDKISGRYIKSVNDLLDDNIDTYGEYKLVLERVAYDYCDPNTKEWENGRLYDAICEVDFALTRPYLMQISTFGFDPKSTNASDFLKDFYDMKGISLIKSTDINDTMDVDYTNYGFDSSVVDQMRLFKDKYESLAILVNNGFKIRGNETVGSLFNGAVVKKVPNKLIFFVEGNNTLVLKQLTKYFPGTPYTIYVQGMDVVVEGSVKTNGMIITDQKIYFDDDSTKNYCEDGGQVVQGIFVAQGGFDTNVELRNKNQNKERCPWGNLYVKGVLIGDGLNNLIENRRSHLNDWFQVDNSSELAVKRERKNEIFNGAALLIEYNPDLWVSLPPGADSFTKTLDVYKK